METISDPAAREQMAQYQRQLMLQFAKRFTDDPELREEFIDKAEKKYQWELNKTPEEKLINPGIALSQYRTDEELKKALGTIHCPVLLVYGIKDAMLLLSRTFLPTAYIPGAKAIFYQDASHFVHYAYRDDIREEISRFANKAFEHFHTCTDKNGSPQKQDSNK
ncbi:MAG: alpha/beta hydrolase [Lachnospiraceae bacterium]|nr:alpha/beta hydrolase [Lachnospiraceae bacterium]